MKKVTRLGVEALKSEMSVLGETMQRAVCGKTGFELGFQRAMKGGFLNDLAAYSVAIISYVAAGSKFGEVNYDMIQNKRWLQLC